MIQVTLQLPHDPDPAVFKKAMAAAKAIASGEHDEVIEAPGAAPADCFSLTVHVLADPEQPAEPEE
jgi:hypothetical protein